MTEDNNVHIHNEYPDDAISNDTQNDDYISVEIFNQSLSLKCSGIDKEYLQNISQYIDDTSSATKKNNPHLTDKDVLILTALNIADMLHRKDFENNEIIKQIENHTNNLHNRMMSIIKNLESKN